MKFFRLLFALALPLLLLTTSLYLVATSPTLYLWGIERYSQAPWLRTAGPGELEQAVREITAYWSSGEEQLQVSMKLGGMETPLFNQKEIDHLVDVKRLIQLDRRLQLVSLGYALAFLIGGFLRRKRNFLRELFSGLQWGGIVTLALVGLLGVAAVVDFGAFFTLFHLASFSNLLWVLDPQQDRLIQMFTQGFFFSATLLVVAATVLGGLGIALVGWWGKRKLPA